MAAYAPLVIQLLNSLSLSMILILIALGLAIIFGLMGVINLAHSELFMLGAYTVVVVNQYIAQNFWLGLALAPIIVGLIGFSLERSIIQHLYKRPLETLLVTWGISIVLRQLVRIVIGPGHRMVIPPIEGVVAILPGINYPVYRLFIIGVTVAILIIVFILFLKTKLGLQCRAVIENRQMASALGINTYMCDSLVFTLGAGLAGFAGAVMSPLVTVNPEMGMAYIAKSFFVVILGGLGNLMGVIGGGLVIGFTESIISYLHSSIVAHICVLLLAIVIIRLRPKGLFGAR